MSDAENKITVEFNLECKKVEFDRAKLEEMLRTVCLHFGCNEASIAIAILDDAAICELNSKFLGSRTSTDVISFDTSLEDSRHFDLAVNAELAVRQAKSRGHEAEPELALYVLHGLLHNLGFDDTDTVQAEKMHKTEDDILQNAGYGVVYNR